MLADTIKSLVGLRRQLREAHAHRARYLGQFAFMKEMSTVQLNAGRCAGHTTAIAQLFSQENSDLIVVGAPMWQNEFQRLSVPKQFVHVKSINRIIRPGSERLIEGTSTIWVDAASFWFHQKELEDLYFAVIGEVNYVHGVEATADQYPIIAILS